MIEFFDSLSKDDSKSETDDEKDDTEDLEGRMDVANFLGGWEVESKSEEWETSEEEDGHDYAVCADEGSVGIGGFLRGRSRSGTGTGKRVRYSICTSRC